jgi:hypothetical protein
MFVLLNQLKEKLVKAKSMPPIIPSPQRLSIFTTFSLYRSFITFIGRLLVYYVYQDKRVELENKKLINWMLKYIKRNRPKVNLLCLPKARDMPVFAYGAAVFSTGGGGHSCVPSIG